LGEVLLEGAARLSLVNWANRSQISLVGNKEVNSGSKLSSVGIIGDSPAMQLLARQIETAASCDLTAVVTGESGTGKELVARALHRQSVRADMPFISINCGAITETLMESELFGLNAEPSPAHTKDVRGYLRPRTRAPYVCSRLDISPTV
jgi:DNA-binding NtrC family response regulator